MQIRISKYLFFNFVSKISHICGPCIKENSSFQSSIYFRPLAGFSSVPNRPMRGESRRRNDDYNSNFEIEKRSDDNNFSRRDQNDRRMKGEQRERNANGSIPFKFSDMMKERDQSKNTHFEKLDFDDMGKKKSQSFDKDLEEMDFDDTPSIETHNDKKSSGSILETVDLGDTSPPRTAKKVRPNNMKIEPPAGADEIFKKMKETGLIPNAVAMLDGLCKDGLVQEAMKLFGSMREKGTIPEVVIYTAVVEGFCKAAKFDDAIRIFRKMQKNEIVPNAISYGIIIQGLCKGKRLDDGIEFCYEMIDAGHAPNAASLIALVHGFCEEKGIEEAAKVLKSLREKRFAIDDRKVREYMDKNGPYSPAVWEAFFGKKKQRAAF